MISIVSLTTAGQILANRLAQLMNAQVLHKPQPFTERVQQAFCDGDQLIFICATGIVMRTLAPVISDKHTDPAVLVMDEQGQFVIPLLSGHEGGANDLAAQVASLIQGQLVSTTANQYLAPVYTVGMGCERHCPKASLLELLEQCLAKAKLPIDKISALASIDIKADEVGLIELAAHLKVPFICYSPQQLASVEHLQVNRSEYVLKTVGASGVAEPSALLSAALLKSDGDMRSSELMLAKHKSKVATCAIGRSYQIP